MTSCSSWLFFCRCFSRFEATAFQFHQRSSQPWEVPQVHRKCLKLRIWSVLVELVFVFWKISGAAVRRKVAKSCRTCFSAPLGSPERVDFLLEDRGTNLKTLGFHGISEICLICVICRHFLHCSGKVDHRADGLGESRCDTKLQLQAQLNHAEPNDSEEFHDDNR